MREKKIARDSYVETLLARRMNGFVKVIITDGYDEVRSDADGIIHVGVIPFMLDETGRICVIHRTPLPDGCGESDEAPGL